MKNGFSMENCQLFCVKVLHKHALKPTTIRTRKCEPSRCSKLRNFKLRFSRFITSYQVKMGFAQSCIYKRFQPVSEFLHKRPSHPSLIYHPWKTPTYSFQSTHSHYSSPYSTHIHLNKSILQESFLTFQVFISRPFKQFLGVDSKQSFMQVDLQSLLYVKTRDTINAKSSDFRQIALKM